MRSGTKLGQFLRGFLPTLLLGKKSNMITPFASQNTVGIALPADGCVLNFFGLGDPGPTY